MDAFPPFSRLCWSQATRHAGVPEDPAAAGGPVHADLQPVPAPLALRLPPAVRRPAGARCPERRARARLCPRGRLGSSPAVRGVSLHLPLLVLLLLGGVQPGKKDFKSCKLPLHEPDQAQGSDAPQQQQQQGGPQEQAHSVPGRPNQHHECAVRRGQSQAPSRQSGRERASLGSRWAQEVNTVARTTWQTVTLRTDSHDQCWPLQC